MKKLRSNVTAVLCVMLLQVVSSTVLERFLSSASPCEKYCDVTYNTVALSTACQKGCRLLTIIGLAKDLPNKNETQESCFSACSEAYGNGPPDLTACEAGCKNEASAPAKSNENVQTLHLLTPLMYVKSAYDTVAHHVRQFVSTSWTLYVQEDSGKMVVLQTNPKTVNIDTSEYGVDSKKAANSAKTSGRGWPEERSDWMDCISQQSGLPRWILVSVLFGFIVALLWLCCVTTVTAPNHHLNSNTKKASPKNDIGYLLLYEPIDEVKIQPPAYEIEAPPLPSKLNVV